MKSNFKVLYTNERGEYIKEFYDNFKENGIIYKVTVPYLSNRSEKSKELTIL